MGGKSLCCFFRKGGGNRKFTIFAQVLQPWEEEIACIDLHCSATQLLMGFRFKAKGINLAGSSAWESYGQKVTQNGIFFHQKYNFSPKPNGLFHWPYQTGPQRILGAGEGGGIFSFLLNHTSPETEQGALQHLAQVVCRTLTCHRSTATQKPGSGVFDVSSSHYPLLLKSLY